MCPACVASAALIGGSVVSTGGLTALVVKMVSPKVIRPRMLRPKSGRPAENIHTAEPINPVKRRNEYGNDELAVNELNNDDE